MMIEFNKIYEHSAILFFIIFIRFFFFYTVQNIKKTVLHQLFFYNDHLQIK